MILGPFAGPIANRFGIRRTAIIAMVASIILTCLMAISTLNRTMNPGPLAVSVVILGSLHVVDFPVRQMLIQLLVGRERMSAAIALNSTTFYAAYFTGPVLCAAVLALGNSYVDNSAPGDRFPYLPDDHGNGARCHFRDADARSAD